MATKTYLLAPDFTYKPDGPIRPGNLIANPFQPEKVLSAPNAPPDVDVTIQKDHALSAEKGHSLNVSLWATFLESLGGGIGGSRSVDTARGFNIDVLETRRLREPPPDDDPELQKRLAEPRVQGVMKGGLRGRAPVYLVTGVKIVRGLTVRTEQSRSYGGNIDSTLPSGLEQVGVSIGAGIGWERRKGGSSSFRAAEDEDVVFAYQVHVIKRRGWKGEKFTVDRLETTEAMLHNDKDEQQGEDEGVAISGADVDELGDAAEDLQYDLQREELVDENGEKFVCIQAHEYD